MASQTVDYVTYCKVVASIDPGRVVAFSFTVPAVLKKLKDDLAEVAALLKESSGLGFEAVVRAFQDKSVFRLLKGLGFSVAKLLQAIQKVAAIPATTLMNALEDLATVLGGPALIEKMGVKERIRILDEVVHRHPILKRLTGLAVAGLFLFMYFQASATGDARRDLDIVDAVLDSIKGKFDLSDLLTSSDGVKDLCLLLFGLATGGAGITAYGAPKMASMLKFLGAHADSAANLLLALFYSAAKRIGVHVKTPHELQAADRIMATLVHPKAEGPKAGRTSKWFHRLEGEEREEYVRRFPGTKFQDKTKLVHPDAQEVTSFVVYPTSMDGELATLGRDVMRRFLNRRSGYERLPDVKGFEFWFGFNGHQDDYLVINGLELVGYIRMYSEDHHQVDKSYVNRKYVGQGIEAKMFDLCLSHTKALRSSTAINPSSSEVWRQLMVRYKGHLVIPTRKVKITVSDWVMNRGAIYPVVKSKGVKTSLFNLAQKAVSPTDMASICTCYYEVRK